MDFNELFDVQGELNNRVTELEQRLIKLTAEVQTYKFLITRIMVEHREATDRLSDLESICASLVLNNAKRSRLNAAEN